MIFEATSYREAIKTWLHQKPNHGRGWRTKMADAMGCRQAFLTHVMGGTNDLSLEQSEALARFMNLNFEETEYFLLLVQLDRAGTTKLKTHLKKIQKEKLSRYHELKNRVRISTTVSREDETIYYSQWYYSAIHTLLTIPEVRYAEDIEKRIRLPIDTILQALEFLESRGFIKKSGNEYSSGNVSLHLAKSSPLIHHHHTNWRLRAIQSFGQEQGTDLHYSACMSIAEKDLPKVQACLSKALEQIAAIVKPSKEERLMGLCMDFFNMG